MQTTFISKHFWVFGLQKPNSKGQLEKKNKGKLTMAEIPVTEKKVEPKSSVPEKEHDGVTDKAVPPTPDVPPKDEDKTAHANAEVPPTMDDKAARINKFLSRAVPILVILLAICIWALFTFNWNSWEAGRSVQRTDNATLEADIIPLSTRSIGTI